MENNNEDGSPYSWWLNNSHNRPHQSQWLQSTLSGLTLFGTKINDVIFELNI